MEDRNDDHIGRLIRELPLPSFLRLAALCFVIQVSITHYISISPSIHFAAERDKRCNRQYGTQDLGLGVTGAPSSPFHHSLRYLTHGALALGVRNELSEGTERSE